MTLSGRGETTDAAPLQELVDRVLALKPGLVVVDLSGVEFFGSYGVNALVRLEKELEESGGEVRLAGPQPAIRDLLDRSHLRDRFPIYSSVEAAIG